MLTTFVPQLEIQPLVPFFDVPGALFTDQLQIHIRIEYTYPVGPELTVQNSGVIPH